MDLPLPFISAILLAGGKGTRIGGPTPKQFVILHNKPIALYSYELFSSLPFIKEIIVVCDPSYNHFFEKKESHSPFFAKPGIERQISVHNGFQLVSPSSEFILIHDSARPFIQKEDVENLVTVGIQTGAAALGTPLTDTLKSVDSSQYVRETVDRNSFYEIQTPQLIEKNLYKKGFLEVEKKGLCLTDDVGLVELLNHPVKIVRGNGQNRKITTPQDLFIARSLFL